MQHGVLLDAVCALAIREDAYDAGAMMSATRAAREAEARSAVQV